MPHSIVTHQESGLVVLSVAVAIVAGYLALDLAQRSAGSAGWTRRGWIAAGGVALGMGIWSMHFIGMMALRMGMPVSYDLPLVALSMFAAILGAVVALAVVARPESRLRGLLFAAAFMGLAIGAMHYLGMASMEMKATIRWNAGLVVLSLLIAFGASLAALYLVVQLGRNRFRLGFARRAAAVLLGLGIADLHYTAMAAATFEPMMAGMDMHQGDLGAGGLVVVLAIGAAMMLAILIGGGAADQRRARTSSRGSTSWRAATRGPASSTAASCARPWTPSSPGPRKRAAPSRWRSSTSTPSSRSITASGTRPATAC
jgi:diguanylate cyclase